MKDALRSLGLSEGDVVMIHASMRAVGGEADALLDSILHVIGPSGTAVMLLGADPDEPFDRLETEVDVEDMGVLAEVFRVRAGDNVSDHPAARFAAIGPLADALVRDPPLHHYYGPRSFLERLLAGHVQVLRLGANIDTITLIHHAEYLADVADKREVTRRYERAAGGPVDITSLDDTDGIKSWAGGDYFTVLTQDYLATNRARVGSVGGCRAELIDGADLIAFAVDWLSREL